MPGQYLFSVVLYLSLTMISAAACPVLAEEIIGGEDADLSEFPHHVGLIREKEDPYRSYFCGASVINRYWVLSADHCLQGEGRDIFLFAGSADLSRKNVIIRIAKIYFHDVGGHFHDVGLARLEHPLDYSDVIKPVSLPAADEVPPDGLLVSVTGWGRTDPDDISIPKPQLLQKVDVSIIPDSVASTAYGARYLPETMLAAGLIEGGKDACNGDSGSALVAKREDGTLVQFGVVSWGRGCARAEFPGIYARVSAFVDWIRETTENI